MRGRRRSYVVRRGGGAYLNMVQPSLWADVFKRVRRPLAQPHSNLTQSTDQMVLESQRPHKTVDLCFD